MPDETALHERLSLQDRRIELMLAIDRIRDEAEDERALLSLAVSAIGEALQADVCLLSLFDDETHALALRALVDRLGVFDHVDHEDLRELAQRAAALPGVQTLEVDRALAESGLGRCLAAPLRLNGETLGALVLISRERAVAAAEQALLSSAVSQLDSAVLHMRTLEDLRRERQELATLYRVDRIRDLGLPFDDMLDAVLVELCRAIPSEAGFIMLFDTAGRQLLLRAATDRDLLAVVDHYRWVHAAALEAVERAETVARSQAIGRLQSLICIPLILNERVIGVFGAINRRGRPAFGSADRRLLAAMASQMDTAIFEGLQIQKYREVFGRRVGPRVMERLLAESERDLLKGERVTVTTLFSDIRGFTGISERIEPEVLVLMLNEHLGAMVEVVHRHEGTVDKFVGDSVMALYNAPARQPDHALRAVKTALDMLAVHRELMAQWDALGWESAPIGIGIDSGETIVGNFGSERRSEYTAISHHVNLASRLCGAAEGDQILIGPHTYALVRDAVEVEPVRGLRLKGVAEVVDAYQVMGLKK